MDGLTALFVRFSLGLFCHALLLPPITDCRFGRRACRWAWLGMFVLLSALAVPLILLVESVSVLFVLEAILTLVLYGGTYVFLSSGSRMRSLFAFTVYGTYFMFLLVLASCLSQVFFGGSHYGTTALRTVFMVFYGLVLRSDSITGGFRATSELDMGWRSPAVFSCVSCLTVYATALAFSILRVGVGLRLAVAGILFLLITSAYIVAGHMILLLGQEQAAWEAEAQRKLMESQLEAEREFVAQAKAYRHDIRHHAALLTDYLERGDAVGAKEYLSQYLTHLDSGALETYCKNPVADALLRLTARRCREGGVPFSAQVSIPETLSLTGPELASVLGNLLENAWEAARGCEAPRLDVTARRKGDTLLLEVRNTVAISVRFAGGLPVTTKPGGGQGMRSVRRTLEKHGGMLHCFQKEGVFYTQAIVPL